MNLAEVFHAALEDLALGPLVESALPARRGETHVIAIGKAAPAMAAGALARLGDARYLVVAPDGTPARGLDIMRASHPMPDARSVRAGRACLAAASAARGQLVVLVSGGASALACVPSEGVTLAAKRAVTRALLRSGASIQELNTVRKHLSLLKGGGLLRAARDASVTTLIASDVIGGTPSEVGSGPSVPDPSTIAEARRILRRHTPAFATLPLTRKKHDGSRISARILASPELLAKTVAGRLRASAVVRVLPPSQASVDELAAEYVRHAGRGPAIYVRAAEPSVLVTGRAGRGGRSTHLAALVAAGLPETRAVTFAAFASDGVDGLSGTAGAIVDHTTRARARVRLGEDALARAVARFDTGSLLRTLGVALPERATGHNLADIHVLIVS